MGDFPIGVGSMEHACAAAMSAVPLDLRNLAIGAGRTFGQLVRDAVYAAAPHLGAASLLDHADALSTVEEPDPLSPSWDQWQEAQRLREHAAEMLAFAEEHGIDIDEDFDRDAEFDFDDCDTQVIPIQRAESAWFSTRAC